MLKNSNKLKHNHIYIDENFGQLMTKRCIGNNSGKVKSPSSQSKFGYVKYWSIFVEDDINHTCGG